MSPTGKRPISSFAQCRLFCHEICERKCSQMIYRAAEPKLFSVQFFVCFEPEFEGRVRGVEHQQREP